MSETKIKFTWGGYYPNYTVYLRTKRSSNIPIYEPVVFDLPSCYESQQVVHRFNKALERWNPEILEDNAEMPGIGFQYPKPEEKTNA
jgi:hypothetical protein